MARPPVENLTFITVDDFTPGIRQRVNRAFVSATTSPHQAPGAATTNTFRCIALPEGGLGPLPRLIQTITIPKPSADSLANLRLGVYMIVGAYVQGNISVGANASAVMLDNLMIAVEWVKTPATATREFRLYRYRAFAPTTLDTVDTVSDTNATAAADPGWQPCQMFTMRANATTATSPGTPGMTYTWISGTGEAGGTTGARWRMFPSPTTPTALTPQTISNSTTIVGPVHGVHQERAVSLAPINYSNGSAAIVFENNEQFYFTPANLLATLNATAEVFEGGTSTGISFIHSMSADQLFVNKSSGGSYMIRGDIEAPTIYRLPGVPSSKVVQTAASTQDGLFYCVLNGGLWTWDGGSQATKVSNQLEDNFWGPVGAPTPFLASNGSTQGTPTGYDANITYYPFYKPYAGRLQHHKNWVLIPNNWLYDMPTKSFWYMDNPADFTAPRTPIMYWNQSMSSDFLVGSPLYITSATDPVAYIYDPQVGAISYQWQSQPLPQSLNKIVDVREFVLVAQGAGTVLVTLTGLVGSTSKTSNTLTATLANTGFPETFRFNVGLTGGGSMQTTHVQVKMVATSTSSTTSAPIIYRYSVGLKERMHDQSAN